MGRSAETGIDIVGRVIDGRRPVGIAVGTENGSDVGRSRLKEGSTVGRLKLSPREGRAIEGNAVGRPVKIPPRDGTASVGRLARSVKIPV